MQLIKKIEQKKFSLLIIFIILTTDLIVLSKSKKNNTRSIQNSVKFITGLATGYGLNTDASEQLKDCFIQKEKHSHKMVDKFIKKTHNSKNNENLDTFNFTKSVLEFFVNLKDCAPFRETILTFIKNRIISIGIKGVAYVIGGPLGLLAKGAYDTVKLTSEINSFYNELQKTHKDFLKLGSAVGKIIYYSQNLLLRKRK